jgi:hypothetical protein
VLGKFCEDEQQVTELIDRAVEEVERIVLGRALETSGKVG